MLGNKNNLVTQEARKKITHPKDASAPNNLLLKYHIWLYTTQPLLSNPSNILQRIGDCGNPTIA